MTSMLSSFFSRDPRAAFPYELPAEKFTVISQEQIFVGKSIKKSEPQEKATCFWTISSNSCSLKAQAQKLKTLKHPNVLAYLDSLEIEGSFYLITEPCQPLAYYLGESNLTSTKLELLVSWGLYQVLNCLKFLHNEAKLSQNNVRNAIFVTASGDWKLAAFQQSGNFSSPQADLNDLASVVLQIFNKNSSLSIEFNSPSALQQIPSRLHPLYKNLCARARSVMAVGDILNECRSVGGFMKNKFVDTLLFLDEFQIRDASEKLSFFVHLNTNLELFPDDIARNKILPKLIHTYEYGDAGAHILLPMFKLGRLFEEEEYQQKIVPCLVKFFSSPDRTTRVKLLDRIDEFACHLKPQVVNDKIYSNLVTGFLDSNAVVRESTVKAIVAIADKLNYKNLNTDLMKYLAQLQGSDPEPSIRTNTTICLGKIGCFVDPGHRQRILIAAFTRALRDPFPAARLAGVIALSATQQYFSLDEVAHRVLPALAHLTVDPEKQVRDQIFKTMSGFEEKLQKVSENPELIAEMEAQVKAGGRGGLLNSDKVPQWADKAIKAISGKFYKFTSNDAQQATSARSSPQSETTEIAANNTKANGGDQQQQRKPVGDGERPTFERNSPVANGGVRDKQQQSKNNVEDDVETIWGSSSVGGNGVGAASLNVDADNWESFCDYSLSRPSSCAAKEDDDIDTKLTKNTSALKFTLGIDGGSSMSSNNNNDWDFLLFTDSVEKKQPQPPSQQTKQEVGVLNIPALSPPSRHNVLHKEYSDLSLLGFGIDEKRQQQSNAEVGTSSTLKTSGSTALLQQDLDFFLSGSNTGTKKPPSSSSTHPIQPLPPPIRNESSKVQKPEPWKKTEKKQKTTTSSDWQEW